MLSNVNIYLREGDFDSGVAHQAGNSCVEKIDRLKALFQCGDKYTQFEIQ